MPQLKCPHCDADLPSERTWDQVAVSTLFAAPAVPDMATQVRCDNCGRISAASDLRVVVADRFVPRRVWPWFLVAAVALSALVWLPLQ